MIIDYFKKQAEHCGNYKADNPTHSEDGELKSKNELMGSSLLKQMGIPVKRRIRKVRCVETGEVFGSATAASHSLGLSDPCVNNAAKKGGTAGGFHWEYADEG